MDQNFSAEEILSHFPGLSTSEADFVATILADQDSDPMIRLHTVANVIESLGVEPIGLYVGVQPVGFFIDVGDDFADTVVWDNIGQKFTLEPWRKFLADAGSREYAKKVG